MRSRTILVTGADARWYPLLQAALNSLFDTNCRGSVAIGLLDLGLDTDQLSSVAANEIQIVKPDVEVNPAHAKTHGLGGALGRAARFHLRDYFPGYEVYIWFDADAWVQTTEFLEPFILGARRRGAAVAREDGIGYCFSEREKRWWNGNMMRLYGRVRGTYLSMLKSINLGVLALAANAPHWAVWEKRFRQAVDHLNKLDVDQHAFFAAIHLDRLDVQFMPARFDWICTLSTPKWNPNRGLFCEPGRQHRPISILHLAGPSKERQYDVATLAGTSIGTGLTYEDARRLRKSAR